MTLPSWPPRAPYVVRDTQDHALALEQRHSTEALYLYGEMAMLVMLWTILDFQRGRVERCPRCVVSQGLIGEVYEQSNDPKCPKCYGTTFVGKDVHANGIRAKVIRPIMFESATEQLLRHGPHGDELVDNGNVQLPADVQLNASDFIFRADATRWQVGRATHDDLRTGFAPHTPKLVIGFQFANLDREDLSSVAYLIPPNNADLVLAAAMRNPRTPPDMSAHEEVNGPLILD